MRAAPEYSKAALGCELAKHHREKTDSVPWEMSFPRALVRTRWFSRIFSYQIVFARAANRLIGGSRPGPGVATVSGLRLWGLPHWHPDRETAALAFRSA